jgi:hypothetical protein
MVGSKIARLGVLFNANQDLHSPSLIFVKVFEIAASSYRFVKQSFILIEHFAKLVDENV